MLKTTKINECDGVKVTETTETNFACVQIPHGAFVFFHLPDYIIIEDQKELDNINSILEKKFENAGRGDVKVITILHGSEITIAGNPPSGISLSGMVSRA